MRALSFDKLNIDRDKWTIALEEERFAYRFYSPADGVLVLDLVGVFNAKHLTSQIDFVNNFIIEINKKVTDVSVVLIFNLSRLTEDRAVKIIYRHLASLHADFFFFVSSGIFQKGRLKFISRLQQRSGILVFNRLENALAFADKINSHHFSGNGKFHQLWASSQFVYRYKNRKKKYIQLAHWQYSDEQHGVNGSVRYYEEGVLHFRATGVVSAMDVHNMLKILFDVGDSLAIDLRKKHHGYIFDLRNVERVTPDARRLLLKLNKSENLAIRVLIVIGSPAARFLVNFCTLNFYCAFRQIRLAKNLHEAFELMQQVKVSGKIDAENPVAVMPENYEALKKLYNETRQTLEKERKRNANSIRGLQNALDIVRSGQFENVRLTPDYWGNEVADEVLKVFSMLQADLPHFRQKKNGSAMSVAFAQSNLCKIVDALSEPVFIFRNNIIVCANRQLFKLLRCNEPDIEQMPLSAIVAPPNVATVEAHLNVFDAHNNIVCNLQSCNGEVLQVTLVSELIVVDGENAQLVFLKRPVLPSSSPADNSESVWPQQPACNTYFEKAQITLLNAYADFFAEMKHYSYFHVQPVNTIEHFVEHRFVTQLSHFIQGMQEEISSLRQTTRSAFIILPHDCVNRLFRVFNAYATMKSEHNNSVQLKVEPVQTLTLAINDVFINTVLFKFLQLLSANCKNAVFTIVFKQSENGSALFYIEHTCPDLDVVTKLQNTELPEELLVSQIEDALKCAGGRLFMRANESEHAAIGLQIPVLARGGGFHGAMADFHFHTMLVLIQDDFQFIENALLRTHVNLIQKQHISDAMRIDFATLSLVIVDLQLQFGDPFDFIRKLKNVIPNLPVVAIANFSSHEEWKMVNNSKADAVIDFPINSNELIRTIQQLLPN
ncbi:MAG: hypothetical protein PF489_02930 [Salinivirgaceae bacterium]|jgi:CheY-like chemotaxis protein|nr:hypothetical protein [Salinivirgaceae bacterium]